MLKSLDILVGVTTVMLVLSLVVTVLTQFSVQLLKLRTHCLRDGMIDLFATLEWRFSGDGGRRLADEIAGTNGAAREAITREELVEALLARAHGEVRANLAALAPGCDLGEALAGARRSAMEMAIERPHLASATLRGMALSKGPAAAITSQVFAVFDAAMDRATARFTAVNRWVVIAFASSIAVALPVDTFDLFQRFARSDLARAEAVQLAESLVLRSGLPEGGRDVQIALAKLEAAEAIVVPRTIHEWRIRAMRVNRLGVVVSALLLSLGAPFWFHILQDLAQLRSTAASQEKLDRMHRDRQQMALSGFPRVESRPPA